MPYVGAAVIEALMGEYIGVVDPYRYATLGLVHCATLGLVHYATLGLVHCGARATIPTPTTLPWLKAMPLWRASYRDEIQAYPYQEAMSHQTAVVDRVVAKAQADGVSFA